LFNGQCISLVILLVIGILSVLEINSTQSGLVIGALLLIFTFAYNATIGPITYSIVAELPSTRLKAKTINLARTAYLISALVNNAITTPLLNPTGANLGAKIAWIFVGITGFCAVFTFFCVPEPKDLTYGQIDDLFSRKVSARKFKLEGIRLRAEEADRAGEVQLIDDITSHREP
jgi:SP family general alpha glucoside:H+ symporter-like MFS transporter